MDAYLAVISVRVVREYSDRPISKESVRRILEAGRATGSSQNRQAWKLYVIRERQRLANLAPMVYAPQNIATCRMGIAIASTAKSSFDGGRVAQNMVLAAWNEGIGSAPNSAREVVDAHRLLGIPEEETIVTILSFGYPARPWTPRERDAEGILRRINRKPLDELVVWVDGE